jgi:hypothetical protein
MTPVWSKRTDVADHVLTVRWLKRWNFAPTKPNPTVRNGVNCDDGPEDPAYTRNAKIARPRSTQSTVARRAPILRESTTGVARSATGVAGAITVETNGAAASTIEPARLRRAATDQPPARVSIVTSASGDRRSTLTRGCSRRGAVSRHSISDHCTCTTRPKFR